MGILRFFRWLDEQPKDFAELRPLYRRNRSEPEDGHVVLVDGFGFWITLIRLCVHPEHSDVQQTLLKDPATGKALPLPTADDADLTGGDLWVLEAAIRRIVTSLAENYGVKLVFLLDGERHTAVEETAGVQPGANKGGSATELSALADTVRDKVRAERHKEGLLAKLHTYDYCNGKTQRKARLQRDNRPAETVPPLAFEEFYYVLERAVRSASDPTKPLAEVVQLQGEVDTEIGALMSYYKAEFVFTNDSDFFVTPGLRSVVLNAFPFPLFLAQDDEVTLPNPLPLSVYSCERFCQRLNIEPRQLALAATLAGNDMTRDLVDEGRLGEILDKVKNRQSWNDPTILDNPVVKASIEQYIGGSSRSPFERGMPPSMEPEMRRVLASVPRGLLTTFFYGRTSEDVRPLCNAKFAYLSDFVTFARLRVVAARLLGRESLVVYRDGATTPEPVDMALPADLENLVHQAPPTASVEVFKWLKTIFAMPDATTGEAKSKAVFFLACVLWTLRPTLMSQRELQLMALVVAVTTQLSKLVDTNFTVAGADEVASAKALGQILSVSTPHAVKDRPQARCMELASLFGSAFLAVEEIFVLLNAWREVPDTAVNPSHVLSGSVLHYLHRLVDDEKQLPFNVFADTFSLTPKPLDDSHRPSRLRIPPEQVQLAKVAATAALDAAKRLLAAVPDDPEAFLDADKFPWRMSPLQERMTWAGLLLNDAAQKLEAVGTELDTNLKMLPQGSPNSRRNAFPVITAATSSTDESASRPILPTERHIDKVLAAVRDHRVVCIQGDTGCGKSSIIPLHLLLNAEQNDEDAFIVVTQPRRLAATSLAQRVASLLGEEVGTRVGYRLGGGVRADPSDRHRSLIFVTTGYLLELLAHSGGEAFFARMTHLVLDEVHERSIDADMLGLVARLMMGQDGPAGEDDNSSLTDVSVEERVRWWAARSEEYRAGCTRLLIMSATINPELFLNYYSALGWTPVAPVLQVGEKRFDVKEIYVDEFLETLTRDHPGKVPRYIVSQLEPFVETVSKFERAPSTNAKAMFAVCQFVFMCVQPGTCVLVFLPGLGEIEEVFNEMENSKGGAPCRIRLHALHSVVPGDEQQAAMVPAAADECKVVLSTNIAETSLTIPDVKVVIDLGLSRHVFFDKKTNMRALQMTRCSQAAARQRMGRAGRVSSGTVLRLYSRDVYARMEAFDEPEIYPLEYTVLLVRECLAAFGSVRDVMQMLIEPPAMTEVNKAIRRLIEWGALGPDPQLETLRLGRVAVRLPVDVLTTRAILQAVSYGCVADMVIIAAGLGLSRPLVRHQIRPFFSSTQEFQKACGESLAACAEMDLGRRNDLFIFLSIYEMLGLENGFNRTNAFLQVQKYYLSPPQLKAFSSSVRSMAQSLLRLLDEYELTQLDAQNLAILAGQRFSQAAKGLTSAKAPAGRAVVASVPLDAAQPTAGGGKKSRSKEVAEEPEAPVGFRCSALHDPSSAYFLQLVLASAADGALKVTYKPPSTGGVLGAPKTQEERRNTVRIHRIPENMLPPVISRDNSTGVWEHNVTDTASQGPVLRALKDFGSVQRLRSLPGDNQKKAPVNKWKRMAQGDGENNGDGGGARTIVVVFSDDPEFTLLMKDNANRVMRHPTSLSPAVFALTHYASIAMMKPTGSFPLAVAAEDLVLPMPVAPATCVLNVLQTDKHGGEDGKKASKASFRTDRWSMVSTESAIRVSAPTANSSTVSFALCFQMMQTGQAFTAAHAMMFYLPSATLDVEDGLFNILGVLASQQPVDADDTALTASFSQEVRMNSADSYSYESATTLSHLKYSRYPGLDLAEMHRDVNQSTFILLLVELNALLGLRVARNSVSRKDLRRLIGEVRRAASQSARCPPPPASGGDAAADEAWHEMLVQPEPWSSKEGEYCLFFAWDLEALVSPLTRHLQKNVKDLVLAFARIIGADGFTRGREARAQAMHQAAPGPAAATKLTATRVDPSAALAPIASGQTAAGHGHGSVAEKEREKELVLRYCVARSVADKKKPKDRWVSVQRLRDVVHSAKLRATLPPALAPITDVTTDANIEHVLQLWERNGWFTAGPIPKKGKPKPELYFLTSQGDEACRRAPAELAQWRSGMAAPAPAPARPARGTPAQAAAAAPAQRPLPRSVATAVTTTTATVPQPRGSGAPSSSMERVVLYLTAYNMKRRKGSKSSQQWVDHNKLFQLMLNREARASLPPDVVSELNAVDVEDRRKTMKQLEAAAESLVRRGALTVVTPASRVPSARYELTPDGAAALQLDRPRRAQ